jgi:CHAD domain-containing protein
VPRRIGRNEDVGEALWRLTAADIAGAQALLGATGPREERIHGARQRLKRARSLVRVLQPALGPAGEELNQSLAAVARLLAGARDADAAAASARGLRATASGNQAIGLDRVVADLDDRAARLHAAATPVEEAARRLGLIETELAALRVPVDGAELFDRALKRSYTRGRSALERADLSLSTTDLHRWRKTVKDLWHLVTLAGRRLPKRSGRVARRLHRLAELLGTDHDHAMLAERLALAPTADPALIEQLGLIARERRAIERAAFAAGRKAYRKAPKKFRRAMRLA